jgi:hypothetical protein
MTTKLDGPVKREIDIDGAAYTLTIAPDGMALVPKGRRKGFELKWNDLVSGDAALATALNASLTARLSQPSSAEVAAKPTSARAPASPARPPKRGRK